MDQCRDHLIRDEVLEEEGGCDSGQAEERHGAGDEQDTVDDCPLNRLRRCNAGSFLKGILVEDALALTAS